MKKIKVAYINFWDNFDPENSLFTKLLRKNHEVVITNVDDADYVFFSLWGDEHLRVPDRCIKIFYTGEHICPDFNTCDYAMGFDWLTYGDRYFRLPHYAIYGRECPLMETKHLDIDRDDIRKKHSKFCSFTVSNNNRCDAIREKFFYELNKYKQVDSGGRWNNNVGGPVKDKLLFDEEHKFSIAFENISHRGYTTEKIVQAFAARTIPIYWGDPDITKVFNPKAFINVMDYSSLDEVVAKVREIDMDDNLYFEMLLEPAIIEDKYSIDSLHKGLTLFLNNIVDQPIVKAQRRNRITFYISNRIKILDAYYKNKRSSILLRVFNKLLSEINRLI